MRESGLIMEWQKRAHLARLNLEAVGAADDPEHAFGVTEDDIRSEERRRKELSNGSPDSKSLK